MRGKYSFDNLKYLQLTLNIMTKKEQNLIINKSFDDNWKYLWSNDDNTKNNDYYNSKKKFDKFKSKYLQLFDNNTDKWKYPEWGFPKEEKSKESDIKCAKREFTEETNINSSEFDILDIKPFERVYWY